MNYLDAIIILPIIWGAFNGFRKGFIIEAASLLGFLAGIYGAIQFSFLIEDLLKAQLDWSPRIIQWLALFLTFLIIVIAVHLIAKGIQRLVNIAMLGIPNRIAGMFFGIIKYILIVSMMLYFADRIDQRYPFISADLKEGSLLYGFVSDIVLFIFPKLKAYYEAGYQSSSALIPGS